MSFFPISTTLLLITLILSWSFKKFGHRSRTRRKRTTRDDHEDKIAASESIPAPENDREIREIFDRGEQDARIAFLESKLQEKDSKLQEKEEENLQLKKDALK